MFRPTRHHHRYSIGCGNAEPAQLRDRGEGPLSQLGIAYGHMTGGEHCNRTGSRPGMEIHKIRDAGKDLVASARAGHGLRQRCCNFRQLLAFLIGVCLG